MKRMIMIAGAAAALMAGGWTQPEEMPAGMPDMDAMLAMMDAYSKPDDAHHKYLEKMAGEWDMTAKFSMTPGSPPEISKGTTKGTLVLGGRHLMNKVQMDMKMMGKTMDFSGIGFFGYDKGTNQFVSTWMDSMGTGQMRQVGVLEDGNIVVSGETKHPMMGEYTVKNVIKFVEGGYNMEFWEKGQMTGGELMNTGVIEYRRAEAEHGEHGEHVEQRDHDGHGHD